MNPFDAIEKFITEHGSAAILREHLELLRTQIAERDALIQDQARLLKERDLEIQRLKIQKPPDVCPYCRRVTGELMDIKPHPYLGAAGVAVHFYRCTHCGKTYDKQVTPNA